MYKNKNNSGFAHHALLGGVLVIAITSFVGVKVLTASHAQNLQSANTRSIVLPSCGLLEIDYLNGRQIVPNDPNIYSKMDTTFIIKKKDYITGFRPVFKIWNSKTGWTDRDTYTRSVGQSVLKERIFFAFKIPIWVATADPGFKVKLDVYGKKYGIVRCHSEIKVYAGAVCDAKTGLWALTSKWPAY